jgi:hypothetical protein
MATVNTANTTIIVVIKTLMTHQNIKVAELRWLESIIDNPAKWTFGDIRRLEEMASTES